MSVEFERVEIVSFPSGDRGESESVDIVYRLYTTKPAPGNRVILDAILQSKIPQSGEYLGEKVPIEAAGVSWADNTVFCARHRHTNEFQSDRHSRRHMITVTFEELTRRNREDPHIERDPLLRPIERTVEYIVEQEEITLAANVGELPGREAGKVGPIVNTAGQPVERRYFRNVRVPVLVLRKWVSGFTRNVQINSQFDNTTNAAAWNGIAKHKAKFLSADLTGPEWWLGQPRYQLAVKVAFSRREWYLRVPNVGTKVRDEEGNLQEALTYDGFPSQFALTEDGKADADNAVPKLLEYRDLDAADYSQLDTLINSYQ